MKKELSHGFTITDNRSLGCGVQIENNKKDIIIGNLSYGLKSGVYINISSCWLESNQVENFIDQIKILKKVATEANKILKENEQ